jgi:hypothetical protein
VKAKFGSGSAEEGLFAAARWRVIAEGNSWNCRAAHCTLATLRTVGSCLKWRRSTGIADPDEVIEMANTPRGRGRRAVMKANPASAPAEVKLPRQRRHRR